MFNFNSLNQTFPLFCILFFYTKFSTSSFIMLQSIGSRSTIYSGIIKLSLISKSFYLLLEEDNMSLTCLCWPDRALFSCTYYFKVCICVNTFFSARTSFIICVSVCVKLVSCEYWHIRKIIGISQVNYFIITFFFNTVFHLYTLVFNTKVNGFAHVFVKL